MSPGPRVGQPPTGRVLVEHGGEEFECDGSSTISDIAGIEPSHLESVFVVRDSDLILPDDQAYYTSLIEKLGDIHTTEINAIKSALKDRGRLTDRRLNISSDRSHHNAGSVRDDAASLAQEIRDYTERIEEDALDELATRRLRVKRELRQSREELELQRDAERLAEHARLTEQLATYRETSEQLAELEGFNRDELEELRELRNGLDRDHNELDELETTIEEKEAEVDEIDETLRSHQDDLSELEQRQSGVEDARSALQTYRNRRDNVAGAERQIAMSRTAAIAGSLGAGAAGGLGAVSGSTLAVGLGILLLLVAVGGGFVYRRANNRLAAIETAKESVLQSARDAGFDVDEVKNVAPAIESFDTELGQARDRVVRTEQRLEDAQDALADLRDEKSKLEDRITENSTALE